jgi:ligand-binding sensor domain-containing protein/signal transduction histidine kinase
MRNFRYLHGNVLFWKMRMNVLPCFDFPRCLVDLKVCCLRLGGRILSTPSSCILKADYENNGMRGGIQMTNYRNWRCGLWVLFALVLGLSGKPGVIHSRLPFRTLPPGVELSNPSVLAIHRDASGFVWVGTQNGLNRFDGVAVKTYNWAKSDGMRISYIHLIREDRNGDLWIGTQEGLFRFDRKTEVFHEPFEAGSAPFVHFDSLISALQFEGDGTLWMGSYQGLARWNPQDGEYRYFQPLTGEPGAFPEGWQRIRDICVEGQDRVWVGTTMGLLLYDRRKDAFSILNGAALGLPFEETGLVCGILKDHEGLIWVATQGNGVFSIRADDLRVQHHFHVASKTHSLTNDVAYGLAEDGDGNIWIATDSGLNAFVRKQDRVVQFLHDRNNPRSIGDNILSKKPVFMDDLLWIGTRYAGVWWADLRPPLFFPHVSNTDNGPAHNVVSAFAQWDDRTVYVATDGGGIDVMDLQSGNFASTRDFQDPMWQLPTDKILALTKDHQGRLWIGTWMEGLIRLDPETGEKRHYKKIEGDVSSLSDDCIFHLICTRSGDVWAATWSNGVCRYDPERDAFVRFEHRPGDLSTVTESPIAFLYEDSRGNIWIASEVSGLNCYDPKTGSMQHFAHKPGKPSLNTNSINCVWEDANGLIHVGTNGGGVCVYDPAQGVFIQTALTRQLGVGNVMSILSDGDQNLWLSTHQGLCRYDPLTQKLNQFDASDGLHDSRFGRWSALSLNNGELLFGGTNGFTRVRPDRYSNEEALPTPVITGVKLQDDQRISFLESPRDDAGAVLPVRLPSTTRNLAFEFTAAWFRQAEKLQFQYRLEGIDEEWTTTQTLREAHYRNLSFGKYRFLVQVCNQDGVWNPDPACLAFTIDTPVIHRWYSRLAFGLALLAMVWFAVHIRLKQLELAKLELERRIAERTKELDASNRRLQEQQGEIAQQNETLVRLNQSKDRLFSIFAHDIKNPFNAVLSVSDLLHNHYEEYSEKEIRESIEFIHLTSNDVYELLENLLYWSVSQEGQIPFAPESIGVGAAIEPAIRLYEVIARQKGLQLHTQVPIEEVVILADPHLLAMLIRNLLNNAIKFTPKGGKVRLSVRHSGGWVEWCVEDSGPGFHASALLMLKEESKGRYSSGAGTGLGLTLCRDIVQRHGGTLEMGNRAEGGGRVCVKLPKADESGRPNAVARA